MCAKNLASGQCSDLVQSMDDYIGAVVRLRELLPLRNGTVIAAGTMLRVTSHWRGRLTLSDLHEEKIVVRHLDRRLVDVLAVKLA